MDSGSYGEWKQKLDDAVNQNDQDGKVNISVRELLWWFGAHRRGREVVSWIRRELARRKLYTSPDFEFEWIDAPISILPRPAQNETSDIPATTTPSPNLTTVAATETVSPSVASGAFVDPTYRVGKLEAANRVPKYVSPDATISEAVAIMLKEGYSQLPVMTSLREVKGDISWRSIASRITIGGPRTHVRECMDQSTEIVDSDISLFRVIGLIADKGFVLVRGKDKQISGIVTESDLGHSFYQLGQPFLLLAEIENHIRGLIDGKFTAEELQSARHSGDTTRIIEDVSDLNFGEYVRLLENQGRWEKIKLNVDRSSFIETLKKVNVIRNDVMHFDPDGIDENDLDELRKTAKFVQELREIAGK